MIQSAQVIIYVNQNHSCLNAIKAEQLMVGKQLLISTSLMNPSGTSIIDQLDFKGHEIAIMEFAD